MSMFFAELAAFFALPFVSRALLVGGLVSLCAALLGVTLVLKRYSMIGDGLSHVGFAAMAIAAALNVLDLQLFIAIPVVMLAAFLLLRLGTGAGVKGDAAIGVIATLSLAVGYIFLYRAGTNVDISAYMFGNMFTIRDTDAWLSVGICIAVLLFFLLFYHKLFAVTFDETFAKAGGMPVTVYNTVIAATTAVTVVLGMRMMGTLLITALVIFPALTAMRVCKSFKSVVITAAVVSLACFCLGTVVAHFLNFPAGSTVVVANGIAFAVTSVISKIHK
ncbi:MAG: metal ABC transporter permease [Elusimicrobiaceae bacterium]|nr:metal ABC transporter permease [Clostridia bacterium]MBP3514509.1 metal ABC transporter permease [Elusimicrobiaceae bacterium]